MRGVPTRSNFYGWLFWNRDFNRKRVERITKMDSSYFVLFLSLCVEKLSFYLLFWIPIYVCFSSTTHVVNPRTAVDTIRHPFYRFCPNNSTWIFHHSPSWRDECRTSHALAYPVLSHVITLASSIFAVDYRFFLFLFEESCNWKRGGQRWVVDFLSQSVTSWK